MKTTTILAAPISGLAFAIYDDANKVYMTNAGGSIWLSTDDPAKAKLLASRSIAQRGADAFNRMSKAAKDQMDELGITWEQLNAISVKSKDQRSEQEQEQWMSIFGFEESGRPLWHWSFAPRQCRVVEMTITPSL